MNPLHALGRPPFPGNATVTWAALALLACLAGCAPSDPAPVRPAPVDPAATAPAGRTRTPTVPATSPDLTRNRERETSAQILAYPTGERETSVILLEKRFPTQARLGQAYRYDLKVTNLTDWPVSGVVVREDFPPSFNVQSADAAPATQPAAEDPLVPPPASQPAAAQPPGQDVRYVPGVGYVRDVAGTWWGTPTRRERRGVIAREFLVGTLEPRGTRSIPVAGTSDELGKLDTRTTVTYTPVLAGGTDVINPILKLTKEGPRHADLCEPIEVRYVIANVGVGTETEVRIDEPLPDGLTTEDGSKAVRIDVGDLPQDQRKAYTVKLKAAKTGEYTSRAQAKGFGTAAQSGEVVTAVHAPKLTIAMTGPASEYVGKSAAYTVTVTNAGDAAARNVVLAAAADAGAATTWLPEGHMQPPLTAGGGYAVGVIEPGQSATVRVAARPSLGGPMLVRVTARCDCADPATAAHQTAVQTIASVTMSVVDRDDPVRVGEATRYEITVRNDGSGPDRNLNVVATLPPQMQFVAANGPTAGKADGQKVTFDALPTLAAGQSATWQVDVKATQAGDARFRVDLTSESLTEPVVGTQPTKVY